MFETLGSILKEKLNFGAQAAGGCRACGICCEAFGAVIKASPADIARWEALGRDDILAYVGETGWLWLDPQSGRRLDRCPFLGPQGGAVCTIHDVKPDICRAYPGEAIDRTCVCGVRFPVSLWSRKPSEMN